MKIEICYETKTVICTVAICVTTCVLAYLAYRYNSIAWEQGYTQEQLQNSTLPMWVKPGK